MKNFNMTRYSQLLKLDFVQSRKNFMWGFVLMTLAYLAFFWFSHMSTTHYDMYPPYADYNRVAVINSNTAEMGMFCILIFFFAAASMLFLSEQRKQGRTALLMLPATNLEKFLSRWTYLLVFSLVAGFLTFFLADLIHVVYLLGADMNVEWASDDFLSCWPATHNTRSWVQTASIYSVWLFSHAGFLLGSVLFKRFHFVATAATMALLLVAYATVYNGTGLYQMRLSPDTSAILTLTVSLVGTAVCTGLAYWLFCRWQIVTHKFVNL